MTVGGTRYRWVCRDCDAGADCPGPQCPAGPDCMGGHSDKDADRHTTKNRHSTTSWSEPPLPLPR